MNNHLREEWMKRAFLSAAALALTVALPGSPAMAETSEITIGITICTTGPAAALGIPERNALACR
jgi:branched-chain amino acid transport system substrate-binding protein